MEIGGPLVVIGGQPSGEVLDVVVLSVPFAASGQKFVNGVVVLDVCRFDIGADVVHPALSAFLHLFHHDASQLAVGQWLPGLEAQVVRSELRDALHHIIPQLVATRQEVLNASHDALLLVHL